MYIYICIYVYIYVFIYLLIDLQVGLPKCQQPAYPVKGTTVTGSGRAIPTEVLKENQPAKRTRNKRGQHNMPSKLASESKNALRNLLLVTL